MLDVKKKHENLARSSVTLVKILKALVKIPRPTTISNAAMLAMKILACVCKASCLIRIVNKKEFAVMHHKLIAKNTA